ncbi:FG-GAP-like repeat-containing protein [Aquihabitans daechungensis]|uniref:FG-GAP-like repeat-containing protein n=1 Tax=Aquihabitans daechungensis TaxID=1052257 RepID=UPI003BA14F68
MSSTRRLAAAVTLAVAALASPANTPLAPTSAGAATTTLTLQGTLNHTLASWSTGAGPREAFSSPAIADITGDTTPEIVVASMDGTVEAFRASDRVRIWTRDTGSSPIQSSPTLSDLGSDGKADVVVGTMDGRVLWLDGPSGRIVRTFRQGAPQYCPAGQDCRPDGFFASPAVADINGDGVKDIIAPNYDHSVYAWSRTGGLLWRRFLEDTLWSSPVVADIDRDNRPEIILGGDIWAGNPLGKPAGGLTWILKRDGSTYPGYPKSTPGQTVWSSPAVADLNGDGHKDVIVGTGANWPEPAGRSVNAFTAKTGRNLSGWPVGVDGRVVASPAIGDVDGDGNLDVSFASDGGWVYAYSHTGRRKWRACNATTASGCKTGYSTKAGTVIADVDADGSQEVISALDKDIRVFNGPNGAVEASYRMAHPATFAGGSSPAVAEVNGRTIIAQNTVFRSDGHGGNPRAGDVTKTYVLTTGRGLCRNDWPQFHRDAARTGAWRGGHDAWIPFDCPASFVRQQYEDFLNRTPDADGTTYWTSRLHKGTTGSSVIRSFIGSNEFGKVVSPVVRSYLSIHGTYPPTAATITDGVAALRRGATPAQIADQFAQDPKITALSNEQFVVRTYQFVYKRDPSASERATDVGKLSSGTSRGTLASGYAEGATGAGRLAPEVTVAMVYLGMLGRAPDSSGWSYWVPKARTGSTDALVTGFQRSSEYRNRVL